MKPVLIISIRSSHMDPLPATALQDAIKHVSKNFTEVPVTVCDEVDPSDFELKNAIDMIKKKIDNNQSRYPGQKYSDEEFEYDKSIFWLMQTIKVFNKVQYICSDLSEISKIPLGDPRAEQQRKNREDAMVAALLKAASNPEGGIIFDFGGISHTEGIQKRLAAAPLFKETGAKPEVQFFCVYSDKGQKHIPAEFRMMQFQGGVDKSQYPLGLTFLSSVLENNGDKDVIKKLTDCLTTFCQKYKLTVANNSNNTVELESMATPVTILVVPRSEPIAIPETKEKNKLHYDNNN
jgi:hypothetical protein